MQAKGSLAATSLRSILESAQAERATGTLAIASSESQTPTNLYFLFGHLFHATGEGSSGDDTVIFALSLTSGEFEFDPRAKLPADETVKLSIPELIERASQIPNSQPTSPPPTSVPPRNLPERQPIRQTPVKRASIDKNEWNMNSRAAATPPPAPKAPAKSSKAPRAAKSPAKRTPQSIPVPQGNVIYDTLKSSFINFPNLLKTLERDRYTGYVRLQSDTSTGLIFYRDGQAMECVYDSTEEPHQEQGSIALFKFNQEVNDGDGVVDVISISPELVEGIYQMATAEPLYAELYTAWTDSRALLEFLLQRNHSGPMIVRSRDGMGVIILVDGDLAGAYTTESREVSDSPDAVLVLCDDPDATIEVKASQGLPSESLDISRLLGEQQQAIPTTIPLNEEDLQPMVAAPVMDRIQLPRPPSTINQIPAAGNPIDPAPLLQPGIPTPMQQPGIAPIPAKPVIDWERVIAELQHCTEQALGNRARKVKEILAGADRSQNGVESAIDQIPQVSILFVDTARLEELAGELRAIVYGHLQ